MYGKKWVALRKKEIFNKVLYTRGYGYYKADVYTYYDALSLDKDGKYKYLCEYRSGYFDKVEDVCFKVIGEKPEKEIHILEVYPGLIIYDDNYVPNTELKKIYYEVNDLGSKSLVRK